MKIQMYGSSARGIVRGTTSPVRAYQEGSLVYVYPDPTAAHPGPRRPFFLTDWERHTVCEKIDLLTPVHPLDPFVFRNGADNLCTADLSPRYLHGEERTAPKRHRDRLMSLTETCRRMDRVLACPVRA